MSSLPPAPRRGIFVSDFDGTMTEVDFYLLALDHLIPPGTPDYWQRYLDDQISLFEVLQSVFRSIRTDEPTLLDVMRRVRLTPHLADRVERLRQAGWELWVASAGCSWYIERLFAEQGVQVRVIANPGHFDLEQGLLMQPPVDSPYYSPTRGIDKAAVVREAQSSGLPVAFAGDTVPDLEASLVVAPELRFACSQLADELVKRDVPFERFAAWHEIADRLLAR